MKSKYSTIETILDVVVALCMVIGLVNSAYLLVWAILTLVFACVSKKIGLSKGIDYGYLIGWFLGIIGLIIICVLPNENNVNNTPASTNKYEDLERLQKLKESGVLTQAEFDAEKAKILR